MAKPTLSDVLAAVNSLASVVKTVADRIDATDAVIADLTAPKSAPKTERTKAHRADNLTSEQTIIGTITYIARKGAAAQLDGSEPGKRDRDVPFLNGFKTTTPFADFRIGDRVEVTVGTFQTKDYDPFERVTAVDAITPPVKPSKPTTSRPRIQPPVAGGEDDMARMGIRPSVPTRNNDGCPHCGGTLHPKDAFLAGSQCMFRQFNASGKLGTSDGNPIRFNPTNPDHLEALAAWRRMTPLTVAKSHDGSESFLLRAAGGGISGSRPSKPVTAAIADADMPEEPVKRGRGRPPLSDEEKARRAAVSSQKATKRGPGRPPKSVATERAGKLMSVNNAGTKIQFQEPGHKFEWIVMHGSTALVKQASKLVGKNVTITVTGETVTDVVRLPKAAR